MTQVQIMLYLRYTSAPEGPKYPGQEDKLKHMRYLFENFLIVSKSALASKQGMYLESEAALAERVVEATAAFADAWFPVNGPTIPSVELCARLNNELPFTHGVFTREERTGFGYSSGGSYNSDSYKILSAKVPIAFPGETRPVTMVLPALNKGASE